MAIVGLDGLIVGSITAKSPYWFSKRGLTAEAVGALVSLLYQTGMPGAGVAPTSAIAGDALTTYSGQLPFANPSSGFAYLTLFNAVAQQPGTLILVDRLWHNATIVSTTTTGQTVTSATWPARDRLGATNGDDVLVGLEVSAATTNGGAITNTTLSYTNSAGTGSRTGTITSFPATALAGTFVPFELNAGDTGVRSIQTLTLGTSYGTGVLHLVAYRVLARIGLMEANVARNMDFLALGKPRLFDNTVPTLLWHPGVTTAARIQGQIAYAHG